MTTIRAVHSWPTNGHLIADVAQLGYINDNDSVLDPTYGFGVWWTKYCPIDLTASDLDPSKSPSGTSVDFRDLPWPDASFDVVAFDPPYKLNGTPTESTDSRYGVDQRWSWQHRQQLIRDGIAETARVLRQRGRLLLKCQDQVSSGQFRWQTIEFIDHADGLGLRLVDRFDMTGHVRPQPPGRLQRHAHGRPSTLLVFVKEDRRI